MKLRMNNKPVTAVNEEYEAGSDTDMHSSDDVSDDSTTAQLPIIDLQVNIFLLGSVCHEAALCSIWYAHIAWLHLLVASGIDICFTQQSC